MKALDPVLKVDRTVAEEQWQRYAFMRDHGHDTFLLKADKCDRYLAGDQWLEADLAALRSQRRPALTINKTLSTVATITGEQIRNRAEITFRPKNGSAPETAEALSKVWMQISGANQLPWKRSDVFLDGIVRSRGFYDVRLSFDDQMRGEVTVEQLNSKNVLIDPDATSYDPDEWNDVVTTKWLGGVDISKIYGKDVSKHLEVVAATGFFGIDLIANVRDRFGGEDVRKQMQFYAAGAAGEQTVMRKYRQLERQYRSPDVREFFVDIATGDMREIPDGWERDRISAVMAQYRLGVVKKLVNRVKWCTTIGDLVVHDAWSPFRHFTPIPYFPYFQYGRTIGIVEGLLGPQELLNKSISQELHIINTTANSGWKLKAGALRNMTVEELEAKGAQSGLVMELDDVNSAEKILPNNVPTGIDRISFKAEEFIKSISNVSDSMQGFDREDVAAKAIAYKQQRSSVNFTKVFDNLERTDYILARNVLDIIQEYYTESRIINITHDDPSRQAETLEVNGTDTAGQIVNDLTIGEFDITITSAPYRATLEDSQFEQARAMREIGVKIPDSVLIENSRLHRRVELIKQMQGDQDSPQAKAEAALASRQREAEVSKLEAEAGERQAETQLKQARTQRELQDTNPAVDPELMKMQKELEMREREMQQEFDLAQRKLDQEREAKAAEIQMKREEMEATMALKREEFQGNQALQKEQHQQQMVLDRERHDGEMDIKRTLAARGQAEKETAAEEKAEKKTPR